MRFFDGQVRLALPYKYIGVSSWPLAILTASLLNYYYRRLESRDRPDESELATPAEPAILAVLYGESKAAEIYSWMRRRGHRRWFIRLRFGSCKDISAALSRAN